MTIDRFSNSIKHALAGNQAVSGFFFCGTDPSFVEIMGLAGFNYVIFDMEHGRLGNETMENMIRAAELSGMTPMARVPKGEAGSILRCLEIGAMGIVIPHCLNAQEARNLVSTVKYAPQGRRGYTSNSRANDYGRLSSAGYIHAANNNVLVGVMIEDIAAVEQIEDIAAVDGLDFLIIGTGDLSVDLNCPGELDNPKVITAVDAICQAACKKENLSVGMYVAEPQYIPPCMDKGVRLFIYQSDVDLFMNACRQAVDEFKKSTGNMA